jgi:glycosyltransferase involved in cell wall biosynthesis
MINKKSCLIILEYGIPHYRDFLFDNFKKSFKSFKIIHSGERFENNQKFIAHKGLNINMYGPFSIVFFNPFRLLKADVIISTFNIFKPHTWIWILLMPWKNWILWGQGIGNSNFKPLIIFRKFIINLSRGYVVYTEQGKQKLINNKIDESKITVAGNTLLVKNHKITNGSAYFLYVGRLQERKGLEKAINICIDLKLNLVIVGDGELKEDLKKKYTPNRNIIFYGSIYDEDRLRNLFGDAVAYISPDHVGLGVVHSFAYGVPVITNRNANHAPEFAYCNDCNSYLYEKDEELQETMREAYQNKVKRKQKSEAAYSYFLKKLSSESMIKSFEVHFNKIFNETNHTIL